MSGLCNRTENTWGDREQYSFQKGQVQPRWKVILEFLVMRNTQLPHKLKFYTDLLKRDENVCSKRPACQHPSQLCSEWQKEQKKSNESKRKQSIRQMYIQTEISRQCNIQRNRQLKKPQRVVRQASQGTEADSEEYWLCDFIHVSSRTHGTYL